MLLTERRKIVYHDIANWYRYTSDWLSSGRGTVRSFLQFIVVGNCTYLYEGKSREIH